MPILRPISCFLAAVILLLSTTQRLPAPIMEVEETPTPAPSPKQELSKQKRSATSKTPVNKQAVTKPETRAKPTSPPRSQAKPTSPPRSQGTGRLIISRAANFGWNISLHVQIDGRGVGSIPLGGRYDGVVPTGHHVLTVSVRGTEPTSVDLDVQPGQSYTFTTVWDSDVVALRPVR